MSDSKKKGLGRGLSAVFGDEEPKEKNIAKNDVKQTTIANNDKKITFFLKSFFLSNFTLFSKILTLVVFVLSVTKLLSVSELLMKFTSL